MLQASHQLQAIPRPQVSAISDFLNRRKCIQYSSCNMRKREGVTSSKCYTRVWMLARPNFSYYILLPLISSSTKRNQIYILHPLSSCALKHIGQMLELYTCTYTCSQGRKALCNPRDGRQILCPRQIPLAGCRTSVVADAIDTSIIRVTRLRCAAIPAAASPAAVFAVSSNARVSRLARNGTAAIPTLATTKIQLSARSFNIGDTKMNETYPQVQVSLG